jgi:uncharacterized protein YidB (DUF937 family)
MPQRTSDVGSGDEPDTRDVVMRIIMYLISMLLGRRGGMLAGLLGGPLLGALMGMLRKRGSGGGGGSSQSGGLGGGGLGDLLDKFRGAGLGNKADSWVQKGPNQNLTPDEVEKGLGADQLQELSKQTGLSVDEIRKRLSKGLPQLVDHVTPDGAVPNESGLEGILGKLGKYVGQ